MPYRDDRAALEARRDEIRKDLADVTRHAGALAGARRDQESLARELAAVEARIEEARSRRLPLLETLRIASPCGARWEEMEGDERVRFCGSCQKHVYNLSAMAGADAERLLAERGDEVCVRLYRRADGTVMTTDCPVGQRRRRVKRVAIAVAGAGAMAAASATAVVAARPAPWDGFCAIPTASAIVTEESVAPPVAVTGMPSEVPAPPPSIRPPMGKPAYHDVTVDQGVMGKRRAR